MSVMETRHDAGTTLAVEELDPLEETQSAI
jgi:hypothetical protein